MAIPESQLATWSHQGSVIQSRDTYATIKRALENPNTQYANHDFEVFLQGSYGNDTNIYAESDVDVVIRCNTTFYHNIMELPSNQQTAFHMAFSAETYYYSTYKGHVQAALTAAFGNSVNPGKKAIKVKANDARRNADVVVAFNYVHYYKFNSVFDQSFDTGIVFFTPDNTRIVNYPKQHSENLTRKHQSTNNNFKPIVRIFKNMRSRLVDNGIIGEGVAPSYFIEGLLSNVPDHNFSGNYGNMVLNILRWLYQTPDRTQFLCANKHYYLLRDNDPVCWPCAHGEQFINAVIWLWDHW